MAASFQAILEHLNFTCSDPDRTAAWMCDVFGWKVRWSGPSLDNGYTVHVGSNDRYVALYCPAKDLIKGGSSYGVIGGLNHVAVVVDDLELAEKRVQAAGFVTHSHADYEPGKRFYFHDENEMEYEVVCYGADG